MRIHAAHIPVAVLVLLVASCGSRTESVLDRVRREGVVRIGSNNTVPPMNFLDERGGWTGFDIELSDEIARRLGVRIERVLVNNKTRITFLANGTVDMVVSSMSHTRSRDERIDFAEPPYFWTGKIVYAKRGRFASRAELGGQRIAVVQGSNAYLAIRSELERLGVEPARIVAYQTNAECFMALKQDKVDAYTQDAVIIAGVAGREGVDYEAVGGIYSPGLYGIGVPPNDSRWRDRVSFVLQDIMADGTYEALYGRWFGASGRYPLDPDARPTLPPAFGNPAYPVWPD